VTYDFWEFEFGLETPAIENDFWISATDNFCPSAIIPLYFAIASIDDFLLAYSISQTPVEFPLISLFNNILTISPNSWKIVYYLFYIITNIIRSRFFFMYYKHLKKQHILLITYFNIFCISIWMKISNLNSWCLFSFWCCCS